VTITGNFDAGYSHVSSQTAGASRNEVIGNGSSTSNIKFAGTEDLGGGLKAQFVGVQLISAVAGQTGNTDSTVGKGTNRSNWFNDEIWVGLSGNFGAVKLGAPSAGIYETVAGKSSPFGTALGGGYSSSGITRFGIAASSVGLNQYVGGDSANGRVVRAEESVRYDTPTFSGLNANITFAPKADNKTSSDKANANGFLDTTVNYVNGPLVVAYSQAKIEAGAYTTTGNQGASALAANSDIKHTALAANYTMGPVTVYGGMTTSKTNGGTANTSTVITTFDVKSTNVAVKYAVTPMIDVLANSVKVKDEISTKDQSLLGLSAIYKLSKRTSGYATYQKGDTDKSSSTAGEYKQTIVGLRHQF
jgi:predicted porin